MAHRSPEAKAIAIGGLILSWMVFFWSLGLPAFHLENGREMAGSTVLGYGFFGVLMLQFAWFANPLFLIASVMLFTGAYRAALVFVGAGILISMQSLFIQHVWENEAVKTNVAKIGAAFYLWVLAQIVLAVAAEICRCKGNKEKPSEVPSR